MSGIIDCEIHIGDEVFIHGYIDEIRSDTIIIRNVGGYFGTSRDEVFYYEEDEYGSMNSADRKTENSSEKPNTCETCRYEGECDWKQWQKCYCEPQSVRSNLEPFRVDEPQCEECGHWEHGAGDHYYCALLEMGQECYFESKNESTLMFANEPKTEPEVRSNLEPFRVDELQTERHLPDYSYESDLGRRIIEQTDCAWAAPDAPRTVPLYPMKGGEETNEDNSR